MSNAKARFYAKGRLPQGEMNRTEQEYAQRLRLLQHAGEILWWKFEPIKFRLAAATFYTPDFLVMTGDGFLECHEVKGFWTDDARVKIKVAATTYPMFAFLAVRKQAKKRGGGWEIETF